MYIMGQKQFDEYFAKVVLEKCFPEKFIDLQIEDKPDLRCGSEIGIEVTNCMPREAVEAFNLWQRVAKQGEQTPSRIFGRLEQLKDIVHLEGNKLIWERGSYVEDDIDNSPIKKFINAVASKVEGIKHLRSKKLLRKVCLFESKGLANPNPSTYTIEDNIEFQKLTKEHYTFEWVPSKIEKGTTESITIKGEWKAKEYYITYENLTEDTNHKNKQTYTVEDTLNEGILIAAATRGGYFCEWDINEIPKGHTGDITITVNYIEKTLDQCFNQGIYEIYTPNQFYHLSTQPNGGKGRNYLLMKDLYGMGGYKPVDAFYGNFDGNGHYLSGFWFENSDSEFVGFVAQNFGTIKNLKLGVAITVSSSSNVYAGAFCGENRGTIENCSAFGVRNSPSFSFYATAESFAGGITGVNYGTVKNCGKGLDMSGTSNMGGIVGLNYGNIDGCTNNQEIQINYEGINCCVGGIVGKQESGSTKSCFYNGTIRLLNYNQPSSELANDRNIQICAGIIIGYKKSGVAINNTYENAPGVPGDIVKDVIGLRVVTWTTGSLWWAQTHTHNQALYFKNSTCGRED